MWLGTVGVGVVGVAAVAAVAAVAVVAAVSRADGDAGATAVARSRIALALPTMSAGRFCPLRPGHMLATCSFARGLMK
jgi:hypothetical protein